MNVPDLINAIGNAFKAASFTEWVIFIAALIYVVLTAFENIWCWLFGILSSALSIYLCYTGNLFLESGLQVFYVIIGGYGWHQWLHGSKEKTELNIQSYSINKNLILIGIGSIIWIPFALIANYFSTQVMPFLDAFITAFSLIATWMTAKKVIENWLYWIVIDSLAIVLYAYRGFYLIALLYIIYTLLAAIGYIKWKKISHI